MEEKKVLLIDMYGVIIKESKGNLINYAVNCLGYESKQRVIRIIREKQYHTKASLGEISAREFMSIIGFDNPDKSMRDYLENNLTLDSGFIPFANKNNKYDFVLLSNDICEWSNYLMQYYDLNKYFEEKIISGAVHIRKPDRKIFEYTLKKLNRSPCDCVFVDNSVKNLLAAERLGIKTILFNRDNEKYNGIIVNDFIELDEVVNK